MDGIANYGPILFARYSSCEDGGTSEGSRPVRQRGVIAWDPAEALNFSVGFRQTHSAIRCAAGRGPICSDLLGSLNFLSLSRPQCFPRAFFVRRSVSPKRKSICYKGHFHTRSGSIFRWWLHWSILTRSKLVSPRVLERSGFEGSG